MNDENIIPYKFKKGQSGNPKGRPKGSKSIRSIIKKYLEKEINHKNPLTGKDENLSVQDHMILTAIAKAISGDDRAREDVLNRLYGKPKEHINIKTEKDDMSEEEINEELERLEKLDEQFRDKKKEN